jgi:hypothetical protein
MAAHCACVSLPANLKTIQQYFDLAKDYEDSAVDYWCKPNVQHYIVVIEV